MVWISTRIPDFIKYIFNLHNFILIFIVLLTSNSNSDHFNFSNTFKKTVNYMFIDIFYIKDCGGDSLLVKIWWIYFIITNLILRIFRSFRSIK